MHTAVTKDPARKKKSIHVHVGAEDPLGDFREVLLFFSGQEPSKSDFQVPD